MHVYLKDFGARFRQIFGDPAKLSVGWKLIDKFATLEEREAPLRSGDDEPDADAGEASAQTAQEAGEGDKEG